MSITGLYYDFCALLDELDLSISQKCQNNAKFENNAKLKFSMPDPFQKCQIREIWH